MKQIRRGVFETNSSSTHSLTMCSENEYDKWERGELYLSENDGWSYIGTKDLKNKKFLNQDEVIELLTNSKYPPESNLADMNEEDFVTYLRENEIYTYDNYDNDYLESFEERYTTQNGDTIVAFGQYGHD